MLGTLFLLLIMTLLLFAAIFFFTPQSAVENKKQTEETTSWEEQKEQSKKESASEKNKEWFSPQRWLTDKEIGWATDKLAKNEQFKTLPAHQFHYVKEINYSWFSKQDNYIQESFSKLSQTNGKVEAKAHLAFTELLNEINDNSKELVFIPVNNPDFHWSLLVYETKCFYHFDTLQGANWDYAQPLCEEILSFLLANWQSPSYHLKTRHDFKQGNGWDCGVAVISLIKRIREKYQNDMENIELGNFDFKKEREKLRTEYLQENGAN